MAQPQHRTRCYNCNASLEQAPVVTKQSETPTEKRARRPDLWSDAYTPRPELTPKLPAPGELSKPAVPAAPAPGAPPPRADEVAQLSRGAVPPAPPRPEPRPDPNAPPPSNPHTGRLLRGASLAAEAASFAPPPAKLRTRGSSGDPSEIAPRTARLKPPGEEGAPPPSGPAAAPPGAAPASQPRTGRVPGSGSSGERPVPPDPTGPGRVPTPGQGTALERKRTDVVMRVPHIEGEAPARPPSGARPALPAPGAEKTFGETVNLKPGEAPSFDEITAAIHAANEAARNRPRLTPDEIASAARAFLEQMPEVSNEAPTDDSEPEAPPATAGRATPPPASAGPHYLIAQVLGEPVELRRDEPVRIGRAETNEIVFPLTQISRVHAEVRWDQGSSAFVVIDRNSTNGVFVNNKPVKRRRLADGDRISIGPFTIVYRAGFGPSGNRSRTGDETEVVKSGALSGDLEEMPLPDVLRFIESLKKTGEVAILSATGERGTFFCREGGIVHAEWRDQIGVPAAMSLLRVRQGSFRFSAKPIQVEKATVMVSLTLLLKDALNPQRD